MACAASALPLSYDNNHQALAQVGLNTSVTHPAATLMAAGYVTDTFQSVPYTAVMHEKVYVAVPDRNRILFHRIFQAHH